MGVVYKITNLVNGKIYVGQTTCTEAKRWREHKCAARKQNPKLAIHRAMAKYGFDSFAMEVIDSADSQEELSRKEVEWIVKLNSGTLGHGYNLTAGGEGCSMTDPATKEKIGAKTKARWQDPAMRQHYAENVWTDERRAQYSDQSIAFYATPEGQAAKEAMRAKISKMRTCEACKGIFNGRQWQKHTPFNCPAVMQTKRRVKSETARLACGNAMRGTKRPLDEVTRRTEAVRRAWTPEKRAAWGERMRQRSTGQKGGLAISASQVD